VSAPARSLPLRVARRFPTTFIVATPYVVLFLPLALWNDTPGTDFIITTGAAALAGTVAVETAVTAVSLADRRRCRPSRGAGQQPQQQQRTQWRGDRVAVVARWVAVVSMIANLTSAVAGGGLRATIDGAVPSGIVSLTALFAAWGYVAVALLIAAHAIGGLTRATAVTWLVCLAGTQVVAALIVTVTATAATFVTSLVVLAYLTRLVPTSWLVAAGCFVAAAWPVVYEVRNLRRRASGIAVSDDLSAGDRLRFDEQIIQAQQYGPGHDLGQLDFWGTLRFGVVPRLLDPDRDVLSSGVLINQFMGGTSHSAFNFAPVATAWFFWGTLVVVLLYAAYAGIVAALRPWHGLSARPCALIVIALMMRGPLSWFGTPPDVIAGALQALVAALPVFIVLMTWARAPLRTGSAPRGATPAPHRSLAVR
jgi:hypothetical protein